MADYPPGYDPSHAQFITPQQQSVAACIELAALASIAIGAYVAFGATVASTGGGITLNGVTWYGLTEAEAIALDAAITAQLEGNAILSIEMRLLINKHMFASIGQGMTGISFINYLHSYNIILNQTEFEAFRDFVEASGGHCWRIPYVDHWYCIY